MIPAVVSGRVLRNVYKVLLTRGMIGTLIFSTDPETQTFIRSLLPRLSEAQRISAAAR